MKIVFQAEDGNIFNTIEECEVYEDKAVVYNAIDSIKNETLLWEYYTKKDLNDTLKNLFDEVPEVFKKYINRIYEVLNK